MKEQPHAVWCGAVIMNRGGGGGAFGSDPWGFAAAVVVGDGVWRRGGCLRSDPWGFVAAVPFGYSVRSGCGRARIRRQSTGLPHLECSNPTGSKKADTRRLNSDKVLFSFARGRERCDRNGHAVFLCPGVDFATTGSKITGMSTSSTKLK